MERLYPLFYLGVYLNLLYSVFGAPDELVHDVQLYSKVFLRGCIYLIK